MKGDAGWMTALGPAGSSLSGRRAWMLALLLTLVAAVPRFAALGELSFYADEELSASAARSLAEGDGPVQPSGMVYRRALPLTWVTAVSARTFGVDREVSYRLPVALFGTLTVPLLFLTGRRMVGWPAALVAATLLAFSEWHLGFSRQARMYVPFLFFFILACYGTWKWGRSGRTRDLLLAVLALVAAGSLHLLAVGAVLFAIVAALLPKDGQRETRPLALLLFAVLGGEGVRLYDRLVVVPGYAEMRTPSLSAVTHLEPPELAGTARRAAGDCFFCWLPDDRLASLPTVTLVFVALGIVLGLWVAVVCRPRAKTAASARLNQTARYVAAATAGAAVGLGQLYAAALSAGVFLLLGEESPRPHLARLRLPLLAAGALAVGWLGWAIREFGMIQGLKFTLLYPFPYPTMLLLAMPLVVLAFFGTTAWLCLRPPGPEGHGWRVNALVALFIFAGIGVLSRWGGLRWLFPVYPSLLLVASAGLILGIGAVVRHLGAGSRPVLTSVIGVALAASGAAGGHGVPQAWRVVHLEHGEAVSPFLHMFPFRPDHRGAGRFVRAARLPGDAVIAEDPTQVRWYAGVADYWFRRHGEARRYVRITEDGQLRDVAVNSALLAEPAAVHSVLEATEGRVWFVTSGETYPSRDWYLSGEQRRWLDSLESVRRPAFTAADGVTRVYCLNCPEEGSLEGPAAEAGGG